MGETGKLFRVDFGTPGEPPKTAAQLAYEGQVVQTMAGDLQDVPYCCATADLTTGAVFASLVSRAVVAPQKPPIET